MKGVRLFLAHSSIKHVCFVKTHLLLHAVVAYWGGSWLGQLALVDIHPPCALVDNKWAVEEPQPYHHK